MDNFTTFAGKLLQYTSGFMDNFANRKNIILTFIVVCFGIMAVRLFFIQNVSIFYKTAADQNSLLYEYNYPARGLIYDRNNILLVDNKLTYDLTMVPREVGDFDTALLANILSIPPEELAASVSAIKSKAKKSAVYQFFPLYNQIPLQAYTILQEYSYRFPGFYTQTRNMRSYPRRLGGNLIGYISEADEKDITADDFYTLGSLIGKIGIEKVYEKSLRGTRGTNIHVRDVHNRKQGMYKEGENNITAVAGRNFYSTIDVDLQEYGEQLMQNKIGSIIAMEPSTGEILAMVSAPNFDPSLFTDLHRIDERISVIKNPLKPMFNRTAMAQYPPGSVFKLINALVGLEEGIASVNTTYSCYGGYTVGRKTVGCHHHYSPLNMTQSIQMSCNAYYCQLFRNIIDHPRYDNIHEGFDVWRNYVSSFAIGSKLNSDVSSELASVLPASSLYDRMYGKTGWKSLTIISLAIGQGELGITPLHLANLASIIANRGYYYTPHLVKRIDGEFIDNRFLQPHHTLVRSEHFETVVEGMYLAVHGGFGSTAAIARLPDIEICGKTGTAQNPHGKDHSVFIGFAPRDKPKIAIAVYVENAGFGATYAAPIASLMIEKYLKRQTERTALEEQMLQINLLPKQNATQTAK